MTADDWVRSLELKPHPEGGFYREIYRSAETLGAEQLPKRYGGARNLGTSIYYLLRAGDCSRFHRLKPDEIWYYHAGGAADVHLLTENGTYERWRIGGNPVAGDWPQVIIPHGAWFGATVEVGDYILVGCAVIPGFDFADFEIGERDTLLGLCPSAAAIIKRLCRV